MISVYLLHWGPYINFARCASVSDTTGEKPIRQSGLDFCCSIISNSLFNSRISEFQGDDFSIFSNSSIRFSRAWALLPSTMVSNCEIEYLNNKVNQNLLTKGEKDGNLDFLWEVR